MRKNRMNMKNARERDQLLRMKRLEKENLCFFCNKNYLKLGAAPAIYESLGWYIKKNDYPYKGSRHHYLIVPKDHIRSISDTSDKSWSGLIKAVKWLERKLRVKGYSVFARSGDIHYTGATIDHMHFHFISGVRQPKSNRLRNNILVTIGYKK